MPRVRLLIAAVLLTLGGLLIPAGIASAADYVPSPVPTTAAQTPGAGPTDPTDPASPTDPQDPAAPAPLAYTGAGINLGLSITMGGLVVLLGAGLVVAGTRRSRHSRQS